jgi:hypothetical protein
MQEVLEIPPIWFRKSLQGLAYWVGHRCSIYSGWALSEGALVAELCNLIHAHLSDAYTLRCEVSYPNFLKKSYSHIGDKARVDLSVWRTVTDRDGKKRSRPRFAIEVKRAKSAKGRIDEDLQRLAAIAEESTGIRAFLCVVSEKHLPDRFVSSQGNRKLEPVPIVGTKSSYQVISVVKAAASFNRERIDQAHYCCIVEVLTNQYIEEQRRDEENEAIS